MDSSKCVYYYHCEFAIIIFYVVVIYHRLFYRQARQLGLFASHRMFQSSIAPNPGSVEDESDMQNFFFELFTHTTRFLGYKVTNHHDSLCIYFMYTFHIIKRCCLFYILLMPLIYIYHYFYRLYFWDDLMAKDCLPS